MATVEIGQKIKEVFDQRQMKLTDFADELGHCPPKRLSHF